MAVREPVYFFSSEREKQVTRGLNALLKFNMIDQEARDSLLDLFYEGQNEDKKIVEAIINSHIEASSQRVKELEDQLMKMKLKNNPSYQDGYFKGKLMIPTIDCTIYGSLEGGIKAKKEEIADLETKFKWNSEHKEVAKKLGIIAAWEDELSTQNLEQ